MRRFEDLAHTQNISDQYKGVLAKFRALVQEGPLNLWSPGETEVVAGRRFLIGVAIWSIYDLRLLDVLEDAIHGDKTGSDRIDVFEMSDVWQGDEFKKYIPGLGQVFHTPVVGLWAQNAQVAAYSGAKARNFVLSVYGLSMSLEYDWLKSCTEMEIQKGAGDSIAA